MSQLEEYMNEHKVDPLYLSIAAQVRYLTVWNAMKGNQIPEDKAERIRDAAKLITGTPFTGTLPVPNPIEQQPTEVLHTLKKISLER